MGIKLCDVRVKPEPVIVGHLIYAVVELFGSRTVPAFSFIASLELQAADTGSFALCKFAYCEVVKSLFPRYKFDFVIHKAPPLSLPFCECIEHIVVVIVKMLFLLLALVEILAVPQSLPKIRVQNKTAKNNSKKRTECYNEHTKNIIIYFEHRNLLVDLCVHCSKYKSASFPSHGNDNSFCKIPLIRAIIFHI